MSATNTVQVKYRNVELAATAALSEGPSGSFRLALEAPPPVRTVLSIVDAGATRAFVVVEVVESASEGAARGCIVREVAIDQLPRTVGSERLRDAALGSAEGATTATPAASEPSDDEGDGYGAHMAVPAPVISDDASEPHDVGGDESEGDAGAEGSPGSEEASGAADSGSARAKKRRGRQRR